MKNFKIHGLFLIFFHQLLGINCQCPYTDILYNSYYKEFPTLDSRRFGSKDFEFDPLELDFELDRTQSHTEFFEDESPSRNSTINPVENFTDGQRRNEVRMIFNSYQDEFYQRYSRGLNYSEIFENATNSPPDDYQRSFHSTNYSFTSFPYLNEIYEYLTVLETLGEGRATVIPLREYNGSWNVVHTNSDNVILSIRISSKPLESHEQNPIIVVVAGIHGKDWYAVQSAIFLATELITNENRSRSLDFDWWIVPILNPDGYEISQMDAKWRNWEKNVAGIDDFENNTECFGIDLDLNFEYQWLSCNDTLCDSNFPGEYPFTEPETRGLRDTLEAYSDYIDTFVALKEGTQSLVFPFSDTQESPRHFDGLSKICKKAIESFGKHVEGLYKYGQSSYLIDMRAGFIEDWAKVHLGILKSFAFYLGPREKDRRELKSQHLMDHMNGTFDLLDVIARGRIDVKNRNSSCNIFSSLSSIALIFFIQYFRYK